ncbi:GNAT family N-acetyltransferase [Glaciimonas immobilis]|uniref:GNAT superfamily N-acetyltransferase n=1 Tax=Glaciimonas immobilis TaxID=728004 RepID=A0A840RUH7_9BURK|nr:GNAT family N-acetyltransferase [Glaciimonas immobilis]KAF3997198.1 GNAT family N-acetyltransferase [Glaciimonas immobilis]MBB5202237.1 GNAT superfamily N-acetyltransferase [Glaciimonas immobilis]
MTLPSAVNPASPTITVRLATLDDTDTLVALLAQMDHDIKADSEASSDQQANSAKPHDSMGALKRLDSDGARRVIAQMATYPNFNVLLICADGVAVGTFSLLIFCSLAHGGSQQAVLDAVVISPHCRGQGIGSVMLGHACKIAADAGCYKIALSSSLQRMDAHRFYDSYGFQQHGISFALPL